MSARDEMTPELAAFFAAWIEEVRGDAPPPTQRDRVEWLLEQLAAYASPAEDPEE